jgi:hypothetical protein
MIEDKARGIYQWVQDAVGDVAFGTRIDDLESYYGSKGKKWAKTARSMKKRYGYFDFTGWLADELYNDVDTLHDLCGDKIHDASNELGVRHGDQKFKDTFNRIAKSLGDNGHDALTRACKKLMKDV